MKKTEFIKYLESYGSNISSWPGNAKQDALNAIKKDLELRYILRQEEDFEKFLNLREVEEHSQDFQNRIIISAHKKSTEFTKRRNSLWNYINEIFVSLNIPKPAISLGIVLIIGITLGYLIDNKQISNFLDESNIGVMTLYEGEIYDFEY